MMTKNSIALLLTCLTLGACQDKDEKLIPSCNPDLPPYPTCESNNSNDLDDETNELNLSGKAFIDDFGENYFVIMSYQSDGVFTDITNDNSSDQAELMKGSWNLTGDDISISLPDESFIFRDAKLENGKLSFLSPEQPGRASLIPVLKPTIEQLSKEFSFEGCAGCLIDFNSDRNGLISGDSDDGSGDEAHVPFTWRYMEDGSVLLNFTGGLGSSRYFFTEFTENNLSFVSYNDFTDEPVPYLEKSVFLSISEGSEEGVSNENTENDLNVLNNMAKTNIVESGFPWNGSADGKLKRWDYDNQLIPVKTNGSKLAEDAMDEIEEKLGKTLFDRVSIQNIDDESIAHGLIVSEGSAIGPGGSIDRHTCGHVSGGLATTSFPYYFYDSNGSISTRLYIHISSSMCQADKDIAIHEFGHALGMGSHFQGFGLGPSIDKNFWDVLYNLYHNDIGLSKDGITITY
jgi:hypothetical protein